MPECSDVINTLAPCLIESGTAPALAQFISILIGVVLVVLAPLVLVLLLIWVERKYAARVQDRIGPNRVGPWGLLQNVADALKLIIKEDITPAGADKLIFNVAPIVFMVSVLLIWAVIPISPYHIGADLSIGVVYFLAAASIATLAIIMGGWASNNKYALLGAFRSVALLVSYEVPLVLSVLIPIMLAGSMSMQDIVNAQRGMWFIFMAPVSVLLFFVSSQAEVGRAPFDLIEADSEIVAGYNIEYTGMKFGMFMAGEFIHVFTNAMLLAVLFLGGWVGPFVDAIPALGVLYLGIKATVAYLLSLHLRATLPRLRIDQTMSFNWKFLVPVSIVNILVVALLLKIVQAVGLAPAPELANDFVANLPQTIILLLGNLAVIVGVLQVLRNAGRRERLLGDMEETPEDLAEEDLAHALPATHAH